MPSSRAATLTVSPPLQVDGTAHGIHHARELDQDAVASGLDDPAAMRSNRRIDDFTPHSLDTPDRALLVSTGQTAISDHVSGQDRCQLSLDALGRHGEPLLPMFTKCSPNSTTGTLRAYPADTRFNGRLGSTSEELNPSKSHRPDLDEACGHLAKGPILLQNCLEEQSEP
jgi:hypothetical protein